MGDSEMDRVFQLPLSGSFRFASSSEEETVPSRRSTPQHNMAMQSATVREAAKYLSRLRIGWTAPLWPRVFLIVHKEYAQCALLPQLWHLIRWLAVETPAGDSSIIYVSGVLEECLREGHYGGDPILSMLPSKGRIKFWREDRVGWQKDEVDLVVTLGGDGTVLTASWLFQGVVPPIISFHFGTVGFLNAFSSTEFALILSRILTEGRRVNVRMRLHCLLKRAKDEREQREREGWGEGCERGQGQHEGECEKDYKGDSALYMQTQYHVLNEVVVDRGSYPYMITVDLLSEGRLLTTLQADGMIIATPTGSTAYSVCDCKIYRIVPAMLITPICPHTLSLRPFLLPDSMELCIRLNVNSRSKAWASFDGRARVELSHGDSIIVRTSNYPVPTVCYQDQTEDWFNGLSRCLHWNDRPSAAITTSHE